MRWIGQIFWLLAYGSADAEHTFFPPSPPAHAERLAHGKSYPVTAAQLLPNLTGIPRTGPLIKLNKELSRE